MILARRFEVKGFDPFASAGRDAATVANGETVHVGL